MRIAYIAAGAGGMYCGSCLHDNALAAALQRAGHDVALLPTYTPLKTDEANVSDERVFYGALNVYLQQKSKLFRRTPRFLDRLLDSRRLLGWISKLGASTDPSELGDLTLDMLRGEEGAQAKELDRLVTWLADDYRPEIVVLTNSLLLGLAKRLKETLGVPVVVVLQGEDLFVDGLKEPLREAVRAEMQRRAADPDLFLAPSRYYAGLMAQRLAVAEQRIAVVPLGIELTDYRKAPPREGPPTIGFLARNAPEKGLHNLIEAFVTLAERDKTLRLRIAGYQSAVDRDYIDEQRRTVRDAGLDDRVEFLGEIDRDAKLAFLHSIDLLCVPTTYAEPKGRFVLEAMASGVPVLVPDHGSFPELIESTGGGALCEPQSPTALVTSLEALLADRDERGRLAARGHESVHRDRGADAMAVATARVLEALLTQAAPEAELPVEKSA